MFGGFEFDAQQCGGLFCPLLGQAQLWLLWRHMLVTLAGLSLHGREVTVSPAACVWWMVTDYDLGAFTSDIRNAAFECCWLVDGALGSFNASERQPCFLEELSSKFGANYACSALVLWSFVLFVDAGFVTFFCAVFGDLMGKLATLSLVVFGFLAGFCNTTK